MEARSIWRILILGGVLASRCSRQASIHTLGTLPRKHSALQGWISKVETAIGGAAAGMSDLIATPIQANGTGIDQLLDSLHVSVVPTGTTADVQISLQGVLGDASQPSSLVFTSTNPPQGSSLAAPGAGSLAPVGLAADMQTFLSQFNACMARRVLVRHPTV